MSLETAIAEIQSVHASVVDGLIAANNQLVELQRQADLYRIALEAKTAEFDAHMQGHVVAPPPSPRPRRTDKARKWLGASVDDVPGLTRKQALAVQETRWGRKNILVHYFLTDNEWSDQIQADVNGGRMPILSVKFGTWSSVANGNMQAVVDQFWSRVKALNSPCFVTFHHEPTNDGGSGTDYIAMWKYCTARGRALNVQNAATLWTQIAYDLRVGGPAEAYYPGDDQVDYVGADPYNWPPKPGANWLPFSTIVQHAVKFARAKGKELIIAETGTNEDPGGNVNRKGVWFIEMLAYMRTPDAIDIAGLSYFDNIHTNSDTGITNDWRTNSSPTSSATWKIVANDPLFSLGL